MGAAVVPTRRGQEGVRLTPFDYTGAWVLGPNKFGEKVASEKARVRGLETHPWNYDIKYPNVHQRDAVLRKKMRTSENCLAHL